MLGAACSDAILVSDQLHLGAAIERHQQRIALLGIEPGRLVHESVQQKAYIYTVSPRVSHERITNQQ